MGLPSLLAMQKSLQKQARAPVNTPVSPILSPCSSTNRSWSVANLLVVEEAVMLWNKNDSQTEEEPERSLLDQGLYMIKSLIPKMLNSPSNLPNYSTPPPKPPPITMAPVKPTLLLLRPFLLLSHHLNTKKKNLHTDKPIIRQNDTPSP